MTERKTKSFYTHILLALVFLLNPNFNMIDILPDFVGYFLLARAIGSASELLPYFYETRTALTNLGFVSLARIPAALVMYANMYTGRDIVPLFTLVFSVIEVALLIKAVSNGAAALYYLGERCEAKSLIAPFPFLGKEVQAETVKRATLAFVIIKAALNVLPQFCLLTYSTDNAQLVRFQNMLFPYLELSGMAICLILGILWFTLTKKYLSVIKAEGKVAEGIFALAGEEKLAALDTKSRVKSICRTLIFLAVTSLFSFELAFEETGNMNILPHFIYGIMLTFVGWRLFSAKYRVPLAITSGTYVVLGVIGAFFQGSFFSQYTYLDLAEGSAARAAYLPIEVAGAFECVSFLALAAVMLFGFSDFIRQHTGISPDSDRYGITSQRRHKALCVKGIILFCIAALVQLAKCLNVFFLGQVTVRFSEGGVMLAEPMLSWFGVVVFALSAAYVGYSFFFLGEVREEVKMKYQSEDSSAH